MSGDPKGEGVFWLEMLCLLLVPPVVMGLAIGALSGVEDGAWGTIIGGIVGVSAAKLRMEVRAMRRAD
ncbi:hypothetical protein [Natrononativus amylolyticus]|uniref:hypothetical protein n=1 Tax=Natrononativus amylolyticus TaxID=2963434 RepID=UPI0020CCD40F|nr:hypothetical protein [Natrononativus amylolyticus]